jgi:hypothetical protein
MQNESLIRESLAHQYHQGLKSLSQSLSRLKPTNLRDFSPLKWTLAIRQ